MISELMNMKMKLCSPPEIAEPEIEEGLRHEARAHQTPGFKKKLYEKQTTTYNILLVTFLLRREK